jgi:hypothetical protein
MPSTSPWPIACSTIWSKISYATDVLLKRRRRFSDKVEALNTPSVSLILKNQ